MTTWINGLQIYQHTFANVPDPWVVIRAIDSGSMGYMENLRITGQPEIPDQLDLIAIKENSCWRSESFHEHEDQADSDSFEEFQQNDSAVSKWRFTKELLTAQRTVPAPVIESYIQYQRPMLEDGVIEYEYFHETGVAEVHPMISSQSIMLQQGKSPAIHKLTTFANDDKKLAIDNATPMDGAEVVKLKENDWNQVRLELKGNELLISLNGSLATKLTLTEPSNQRYFGLFRYYFRTS
ncbi:MAG: DUF1583 domain-containing protein [Pirellulales bacterium]